MEVEVAQKNFLQTGRKRPGMTRPYEDAQL